MYSSKDLDYFTNALGHLILNINYIVNFRVGEYCSFEYEQLIIQVITNSITVRVPTLNYTYILINIGKMVCLNGKNLRTRK